MQGMEERINAIDEKIDAVVLERGQVALDYAVDFPAPFTLFSTNVLLLRSQSIPFAKPTTSFTSPP